MVFVIIFFAVGSTVLLHKNSEELQTRDFKDRFGSLYLELNKREDSAINYPLVFMIRRFVYALIIVALSNSSYFQIQIVVFKSSLVMAFQGQVKPYTTSSQNNLELINEILTLICTYGLIIFTDFVPEANARYNSGWVLIGLTLLILVINMIVLFYLSISGLWRKGKIRLKKYKYSKEKPQSIAQQFKPSFTRDFNTDNELLEEQLVKQ